jgi:hypothetical protein
MSGWGFPLSQDAAARSQGESQARYFGRGASRVASRSFQRIHGAPPPHLPGRKYPPLPIFPKSGMLSGSDSHGLRRSLCRRMVCADEVE